MIKVCYVINNLEYGGAQTMLLELLKNLNKDKYEATVVVVGEKLNNSIEEVIEELNIKCFFLSFKTGNVRKKNIFSKIKNYITFRRLLDAIHPNIVHVHLENSYSFLYCLLKRKKMIYTIHSFPDRIYTRMFEFFIKRLYKNGRLFVVGCAKCVTQRMKELTALSDFAFTTIYNPVDIDNFQPTSFLNSNIFINVARMVELKNQKLLLEAFSRVKKVRLDAKLIIVGDGPLYFELVKTAETLGVGESVSFVGNVSNVFYYLARSSCFVLTSTTECCPMSVIEAMAAGLPIVASAVGGCVEIVKDNGLLFENGSIESLVQAMLKITSGKEEMQKMSQRSLYYAQEYKSIEVTKKYEFLYDGFGTEKR